MGRIVITEQMELDFITLYTINKLTTREIATRYNIASSTVCKYLKKNNIPLRSISEVKTKVTTDMINSFIKLYEDGKTSMDIGKMYSISASTVARHLKDNGVDLSVKKTDKYAEDVIDLYKNGMNQEKIQNRLGICKKKR